MEYGQACQLQENLVQAKRGGLADEFLLLLEHSPVITIGRSGHQRNILASRKILEREGIAVWKSPRGGDVTYHGPGQLVGYPILDLRRQGKDLRRYLHLLEEAIIRLLKEYGVEGERREGLRGVWVGEGKICAIGVRVSGWITSHGFAFNVDPDLEHFRLIHPCGLQNGQITSLCKLVGVPVDQRALRAKVASHLGQLFDLEMRQIGEELRVWGFPQTGKDNDGRIVE